MCILYLVVDNFVAIVNFAGFNPILIDIWDTSGQDEFTAIRHLSYTGADVVIMCYDCSNRASFDNITTLWTPEILEKLPDPDVPFILCGTKQDLVSNLHQHEYVTSDEAEELCYNNHWFRSLQCSSHRQVIENDKNVNKVFKTAILAGLHNQTELL